MKSKGRVGGWQRYLCLTEVFAERAADPGPNVTMGEFPKWNSWLTEVCSQIFLATVWSRHFFDIICAE